MFLKISAISRSIEITVDEQDWKYGFCSCFSDTKECCCAFCCPLYYQIGLFSKEDESLCGVWFGGLVALRTKVRTNRGIKVNKTNTCNIQRASKFILRVFKGTIWKDFCAVALCPFCALTQVGREIKDREPIFKAK